MKKFEQYDKATERRMKNYEQYGRIRERISVEQLASLNRCEKWCIEKVENKIEWRECRKEKSWRYLWTRFFPVKFPSLFIFLKGGRKWKKRKKSSGG